MRRTIDPFAYSALVGAIYDCAIDPLLWPRTLDSLRAELRFANVSMSLVSLPAGDFLLNVTSGIEERWKQRMNGYAHDIVAMWGGPSAMWSLPMDRPTLLSEANPSLPHSDNRYIREWREPQGLIDSLVVILAHDADCIGNLAMGRHRDHGPISVVDIANVGLLIPHLQRAARISRLLERTAHAAKSFESVIEKLATPVILVGGDLRAHYFNQAAQAFVERGYPLMWRGDRLSSRDPQTQRSLADLVAEACASDTSLETHAMGLPRPEGGGGFSALTVLPLRRGALGPGFAPSATAAIFISEVRGAPGRTFELLAAIFGLTRAERRVLEQIAGGKTSRQVADALGVAPSTIKTHILRLFAKTGVRRQADLVALSAAVSPP